MKITHVHAHVLEAPISQPFAWSFNSTSTRSTCIVEIVTDDARSARDLPAAAEAEGYAVIKTEPWGTAGAVTITIER